MSQVETVAGTIISISAVTPGTYDGAGYGGSGMNWVPLGEITGGGAYGRAYEEVPHKPIASRATQKLKGGYNEGSTTFELALDRDDAGQVIAKAALNSDNNYSFKIAFQGGDVDYFQAKVLGFPTTIGDQSSVRNGSLSVTITTNSAGVGIVEVNV